MIINLIACLLLPVVAYLLLILYRNELVFAYRIRYLDEYGPCKYEDDLPGYNEMVKYHRVWPVRRLRRYIKRGEL